MIRTRKHRERSGCPLWEWPKLSFTARIERPLLHRGGSASKEGTWPLFPDPSERARSASRRTTRLALPAAKEQVGIAQAGLQMATKERELAKERYAVITAASHFELTNGLSAVARARENLVNALSQLNAARVNLARSTGSLNTLN